MKKLKWKHEEGSYHHDLFYGADKVGQVYLIPPSSIPSWQSFGGGRHVMGYADTVEQAKERCEKYFNDYLTPRMRIEKYWASNLGRAFITTNTYVRTFAHINFLIAEARKDVPDLKDEDVQIFIINSISHKGMLMIEFAVGQRPTEDYLETNNTWRAF